MKRVLKDYQIESEVIFVAHYTRVLFFRNANVDAYFGDHFSKKLQMNCWFAFFIVPIIVSFFKRIRQKSCSLKNASHVKLYPIKF